MSYDVHILNGIEELREFFPDGECDEMNFVLFSTSGIHGSYQTIEDIEEIFKINNASSEEELTTLIIQPRKVSMIYGNIKVKIDDIPFLKKLRMSSKHAISGIG